MHRRDKQREFREALLHTLFPPSPPPPQPHAEVDNEEITGSTSSGVFDVNLIPDDYGLREISSSSSRDDDGEPQKLTRAQRKALRKKKIKEDVSRRSKVIGPLLPPSSSANDGYGNLGGVQKDTPGVRQNADDTDGAASNKLGEPHGGTNQSKLKRRRMAKRLARERLKSSDVENCVQDQSLKSPNAEACDRD